MIPVRLFVRNFMSYGEPGEELDFAFHTACLCGDNGNGKSALLDAMTWALWGRAPRLEGTQIKAEELIRRADGVNEALVEFQFDADGERFRVVRRLRRGRSAALELYVARDGEWRSLTGATISDTQGVIQALLGLDYRTFVMSSFLFQGRADDFTRAAPTERKQVLGRILRLDLYDELARRARDAARECEGRVRQLGEHIAHLQAQVEREPQLAARLTQAQLALEQCGRDLDRCEQALEHARARQAAAERATEALRRDDDALRQTQRDIKSLSAQAAQLERRIADCRAVLSQEPQVREAAARLQAARARDEELNARRDQAAAAEAARQQAASSIQAQQARLEAELTQAERAAADARAQAEQAEALARQVSELQMQIRACRQAEDELEACREQIQQLRQQQAADQQTERTLRAEASETAARLQALAGALARCPLCEQELGQDLRQRLLDQARDLAAHRQASLAELAQAGKRAQTLLRQLEAKLKAIQPHAQRAADLQTQLGRAQRRCEEAAAAANQARELEARAAGLRATLERGDFARDDRERLTAAQARLADIAYDPAEHKRTQQTLRSLAGAEKSLGSIESARSSLPGDEQHVAQTNERLAAAQSNLERLQDERAALAPQAADLDPARQALAQAQRDRSQVAGDRDRLVAEAADLRAQVEGCRRARQEAAACRKQREELEEDRGLYHDLAQAFGRQGVQALVIETVLPRLTEDANDLLERMTEGRMRVNFITQRERADAAPAETLDLQISDDLGTRRYELYSGGEAFRVDFAVRVALARLLAHRAGARLQTLVVDEGFGSQDTQARDRLVECINAIQDDFARVLVVTHIEELKDAFQDRIEVTKDDTGSHLRRVAAAS